MSAKVYIPEPWPSARCWVCGLVKPIVGAVQKPNGSDGLCCEDCFIDPPESKAVAK